MLLPFLSLLISLFSLNFCLNLSLFHFVNVYTSNQIYSLQLYANIEVFFIYYLYFISALFQWPNTVSIVELTITTLMEKDTNLTAVVLLLPGLKGRGLITGKSP